MHAFPRFPSVVHSTWRSDWFIALLCLLRLVSWEYIVETTTKTTELRSGFKFSYHFPPTFANQRHQIPFPRVYVSINERRLKFQQQSIAHKEDCTTA